MTYANREISQAQGAPVELYKFALSTQEWHYTSGDEEVTYDGDVYAPIAIHRSNPEQGQRTASQRLTVTLPQDNEIPLRFRIYVPHGPMSLTVFRYHRSDAETIAFWSGRVRSAVFADDVARLECEPTAAQMERDGLRYQFQASCNHMLYDATCGLDALAYKVATSVSSIDGDDVTASGLSSKPDQWFRAGYLVRGLDYRMIRSHVGDTVTLWLPFENLQEGELIDAYAGCDRSLDTCSAKFGNVLNFGGFPFVPKRNPFNSGLV